MEDFHQIKNFTYYFKIELSLVKTIIFVIKLKKNVTWNWVQLLGRNQFELNQFKIKLVINRWIERFVLNIIYPTHTSYFQNKTEKKRKNLRTRQKKWIPNGNRNWQMGPLGPKLGPHGARTLIIIKYGPTPIWSPKMRLPRVSNSY